MSATETTETTELGTSPASAGDFPPVVYVCAGIALVALGQRFLETGTERIAASVRGMMKGSE